MPLYLPRDARRHGLAVLFICVFRYATFAEEPTAGPGAAEPSSPAAWYGEGVRPTEARSPADERSGFHLPPGFEIQLVASEPQIAKPLNMAFDHQGRLWVTDTLEYPYPAPADRPGRDSIKVLQDHDGDGFAETVTTFVDELNIPMGLLPYQDGVIAFSIPNLYFFRDTDGDGQCDQRQVILGPFDTSRDTHGMVNALRIGFDGWIYACHGFNNQSRVHGADGWEVEMHSGNTFRFRPTGERVEHFTHGQVNPFGMTVDAWGTWFTADCHSKPITQLMRGGFYSSFGRPDDGLGLVPPMMDHLHGSTAIAGLVYYEEGSFPPEYQQQFYSGNVMTSRINRNAARRSGATWKATELADFLTSDDPWFRPVDLQIAPDGSLYVADFYNRIIGHYEVPLDHAGRDRERGRIWRIAHTATPEADEAPATSCIKVPTTNTAARLRAIQLAVDQRDCSRLADASEVQQVIDRIWYEARLQELSETQLLASMRHAASEVRKHACDVAAEQTSWSDAVYQQALSALTDDEPLVVLAAVQAIGRHPKAESVIALLDRLMQVPKEDPVLRQAVRIAVRDCLLEPDVIEKLEIPTILDGATSEEFASILLGAKTSTSAEWTMLDLQHNDRDLSKFEAHVRHAIKYLPNATLQEFTQWLRGRSHDDIEQQRRLLRWIRETRTGDAHTTLPAAEAWARQWSRKSFENLLTLVDSNRPRPLAWSRDQSSEGWPRQARDATDDVKYQQYLSSFGLGEGYTGVLRSEVFAAPAELSFWIAGHDGHPDQPLANKNFVRLIHAETSETLLQVAPPRHDRAQKVEWDLHEWSQQPVYMEVTDGNDGKAYAWLALGRFDFAPLEPDMVTDAFAPWLQIITDYQLNDFLTAIDRLLSHSETLSDVVRLDLLHAHATLRNDTAALAVIETLRQVASVCELLSTLQPALVTGQAAEVDRAWLREAFRVRTSEGVERIARSLAGRRESLPWLVQAVADGWLDGNVLRLKEVETALESLGTKELQQQAQDLIDQLPSIDEQQRMLVDQYLAAFKEAPGDQARGAEVFGKHCAVCHQIKGAGAVVGPQLDGIGGRGPARLLEDLMQPDRNVDRAFRVTSFVLVDGTICVGLVQQESSTSITVIENNGKPRQLSPDEIETRVDTVRSLMPSGLHTTVGDEGLRDLLSYLLSQSRSQ